MAEVVVMGAGVVGLTTAMLLSNDGHQVVVVERDQAQPDGDQDALWADWERRGVNQFRLLHYFQPRFRAGLERELPAVVDALDAAGALRHNVMALVPAEMSGGFRDDDAQFETLTARRPVMEAVLARTAAAMPGVDIRRGVAIEGLVPGTPNEPDVPHVVGVRTADGEEINADLIVDTLGRRSPLAGWLPAIDARPPIEEREDCGFVYYGRHFRSPDGSVPGMIAALLQDYGSISILTLPADNGTWGVGIIVSARDKAARALKDVDVWNRALAAFPLAAHWADGEPIDDGVAALAGVEDRHRDYCPEGTPVVTGVVSVGDAWACTNPSLGRGATIGFLHALALRDTMRGGVLDVPGKFAREFAAATADAVEPWYRSTLAYDRARLAEIEAEIAGQPHAADEVWQLTRALTSAAGKDGDMLRARLAIAGLLQSVDEVFATPGLFERVLELGAGWRDEPTWGPSREEFLKVLAGCERPRPTTEVTVQPSDVVSTYGAAWNEPDEPVRRKMLEQAWADDGVYCDPTATADGRDALVAHIAGFHQMFPGARIELVSGVDEHDGWLRFAWALVDADGATVSEGFDVGELAPDGRLRRIVGFFGPFPPPAA